MTDIPLTPIQKRLYTLLLDGRPHAREELHACVDDELSGQTALRFHLSRLRQKLRQTGRTVLCEVYESHFYYRLAAYIAPVGTGTIVR